MKVVNQSQFAPRSFGGFFEDLFHANKGRFFRDDAFNDEWIKSTYQVPVNVKENESGYNLEVIAPGVAKEEFKLQVQDNVLTISFEHKETEQKEEDKLLRSEFRIKSFKRSFTLGDKIDAEKISARYEHGILHLALPKKETAIATNKTIDIQ
jgi:HSP20 family protein